MVFRLGHGHVRSDINFFHGVVENGLPPLTWSCLERHQLFSRDSAKGESAWRPPGSAQPPPNSEGAADAVEECLKCM